MKFRSILAMFLLLALMTTTIACKKNKTTEEETTGYDFNLDTSDGYDYGKLDCEGGTFTLLQCDEGRWNMKTALVPAELTGDEIADEVVRRNRKIETMYNVSLACLNRDIYETGDFIRTQCMNGDTTVDAAYVIGSSAPTLLGEGILNDIASTPNIEIYEPWWNQRIREASQFGGSSTLYFAQSDISVTAFELTWSVAVNLDRIATLEMENPYELVKSGEWTIDKMLEMAREGMMPNSDGSYTYTEDSSCILGFVTYNNFATAGINGANCFMTQKDVVGNPAFTGQGEKFVDVVEKWARAFHTEGVATEAQQDGFHYESVFASERALFAGVEVKAFASYRGTYMNYGILPVPKYTADQESYYSNVNYLAPVLVIPETNSAAEKTGRILDTMAYMSYKELLPVYYNNNLCYKALGNAEAVEMLDIIRDTRCFETGLLFGWTTEYYDDIREVFIGFTSGINVQSVVDEHRTAVLANLDAYIAELQ